MAAPQSETIRGTIQEALPNAMFRIALDTGETTICYLAGKMRMNRIKVLVGDVVEFIPDPYGGKGRIVRRM